MELSLDLPITKHCTLRKLNAYKDIHPFLLGLSSQTSMTDPAFPFESVLSLEPLIDYWRKVADGDTIQAAMGRQIIAEIEKAPELQGHIADSAVLKPHAALIEAMMTALVPPAAKQGTYVAAIMPFQPIPFYTTPGFDEMKFIDRLMEYLLEAEGSDDLGHVKTMKAYAVILQKLYQWGELDNYAIFVPAEDEQTGLTKYFKLEFDPTFCLIEENDAHIDLTDDQLNNLVNNPNDLALWEEVLPSGNFVFSGFSMLKAVEVTDGQMISMLRNDLLQKDALATPEKIEKMQARIQSWLRIPGIELGLIAIEQGELNRITNVYALGKSLLLSHGGPPKCPSWRESSYARIANMHDDEPFLITDLERYDSMTGLEGHLMQQGYRNLLLLPLHSEDRLVGILELASREPAKMTHITAHRLREVSQLFAVAMHRGVEEREDHIQAVIKEQYTSIHPSVEWRFREAAKQFVEQEEAEYHPQADSIVFNDVYPLYGLSDIRGSSEARAAMIREDLIEQLTLARDVFMTSQEHMMLHVVDEVVHRINESLKKIEVDLRSGDEITILQFLREEVEPMVKEVADINEDVKARADLYQETLDSELGILYKRRRDFEESVWHINETIGTYIESQQETIQERIPHFFEMFKTDGVDYNIYVGEALLEKGGFNPMYLSELRIWQLMMMCGIHWSLNQERPFMPIALQTTHLVLVQDLPLSIRFRRDEKKFDVDGAYNIRYEIVKKRIDKATIKGTGERLTQPGFIAIVYSQRREAEEYLRYLRYLIAEGFLEEQIEELNLEDMRGATGLRAIRVRIKDEVPATRKGLTFSTMRKNLFNNRAAGSDGDGLPATAIDLPELEAQRNPTSKGSSDEFAEVRP